ncbi:MAG: hypothetical protein KF784_01875 [Fimbriimonadaceae bacterium]|nr:hypothetical protein [Fimbriimonadaceae bacterium]
MPQKLFEQMVRWDALARKGVREVAPSMAYTPKLRFREFNDTDRRIARYEYGTQGFAVDMRTHLIRGYSNGAQEAVDPTLPDLSEETLLSMLEPFAEMSGYEWPFDLYLAEDRGDAAFFHLLPAYRGVSFTYGAAVTAEIERKHGILKSYTGSFPPTPPADLSPAITVEQARAKLTASILSNYVRVDTLFERHRVRLAIWDPFERGQDRSRGKLGWQHDYLLPEHIQAGQRKQGILVYWAYYHDTVYSHGEPRMAFDVKLDAKTGRILSIDAAGAEGMGGGGSIGVSAPFSWDLGLGTIGIAYNGRTQTVIDADAIATAKVSKPPTEGKEVTLQRGRLIIRAKFDPKSGLLWSGRGKSLRYAIPNARLLEGLKAVIKE